MPPDTTSPGRSEVRDRIGAALEGRYEVAREVGRGGMGCVFLARDLKFDRAVAIKALHPELATSLGARRFLTEIRLAANLNHPHIVPLFESGEAGGVPFYVMPFVEGESLRERLEREGALGVDDAVRIAAQVADALAYAHAHGVVHRDIKPENILLAGHGHASVVDFGVARAVSRAEDRITATGLILGSPPYLSPEQADLASAVDGRADIYSLGCVLHEMLAGTPPFGASGVRAVLLRHLTEAPPPLRALRPEVPAAVERAVLTALAKAPEERFATAAEFAAALVGGAEGDPPPRRRVPRAVRHAGRPAVLLATLATLAALAGRSWGRVAPPADTPAAVAVLPFEGAGPAPRAVEAPPDRWLASSLKLLPLIQVVDPPPALVTGGAWRTLPIRDVARQVPAAAYLVTGSLLGEGPARRLTVGLYDADGNLRYNGSSLRDEAPAQALDRMALEIVRAIAEAEEVDLGDFREVASATTSLSALTELIQGQRHFYRGDTDAAVAAFRRAIQADSAFAPAYYRLSMAETWTPRWDYPAALAAAEAGLRRSDQMAPRWVDLLTAQRHYARRSTDSAMIQFQKALAENPGSPDALLGMSEVLVHSGGLLGESPTVALPVVGKLALADSVYAPIYDHVVELSVYAGAERTARAALPHIRKESTRRLAAGLVALRFGGTREREDALGWLREADLRAVAVMVALLAQERLDLPLADTVAGFLTLPGRTREERVRGARYRMAVLAGAGRWSEAESVWEAAAGRPGFDPWMIHAWLAGLPAGRVADPMFRWAEAQVARRPPSFAPTTRGEANRLEEQNALRALVHRATLGGDSAAVLRLLRIVEAAAPTAAPSDPEPDALGASLHARLNLLAHDTAGAIARLEHAVARVPWSTTWHMPLADAATQRLLLAQLLAARGDRRGAERRLASFGRIWLLGDALYLPAVDATRATLAR